MTNVLSDAGRVRAWAASPAAVRQRLLAITARDWQLADEEPAPVWHRAGATAALAPHGPALAARVPIRTRPWPSAAPAPLGRLAAGGLAHSY